MTVYRLLCVACLSAFMVIAGCAQRETVDVTGSVSWEGTAIPNGDIVFIDVDPHVPAAAGKIIEGAYAFECKPGKKRVEIQAYRLSGRKTAQGMPIGDMYIPDRYSTASELTADVSFDSDNEFDFDLKP